MNVGDVFLRLLADASGFRRDAETKTKAATAGLSTSVTVRVDDKGTVKSFVSRMTAASKATDTTAASVTGLAGGAMPALIGAGVALSPVIVTVATGTAGFGLAAAGIIAPVLKAAQSTKGLQANLAKLDPASRTAALGVLSLKSAYGQFEKVLAPSVLADFNGGLRIAKTLMHATQPVALATGRALGGVLGRIDAEFKSRTWQDFFHFMAATAGPDVKMLGDLFVTLMGDLPPLMRSLQPLAVMLIGLATDAGKLVGGLERVHLALPGLGVAIGAMVAGPLGALAGGALGAALEYTRLHTSVAHINPVLLDNKQALAAVALKAGGLGPAIVSVYTRLDALKDKAGPAAKGAGRVGLAAKASAASLAAMATAVSNLNTAQSKSLATAANYAASLVTSANDAHALRIALRASGDQIGTHTQAQRNSFAAATTYVNDLSAQALAAVASGKGAAGAAKAIAQGLPILEAAKSKSHAYWTEVSILKGWLDRLRAERAIHEAVTVSGTGHWTVITPGKIGLPGGSAGGPFAAGGLVRGGIPGRDSVPIWAMPGEAVVPTRLVPQVAPFLGAHGVPGFAAGGIVPGYAGNVAGLGPWAGHNFTATIRSVTASIAGSMAHAFAAAIPGAVGGSVGSWIAQSLAINRLPGWWGPLMGVLVGKESGGNARAFNPVSVLGQHAEGVAQMLPSTFANWTLGGSIWNPVANLVASERYIENLYGNPRNIPGLLGGNYIGYDRKSGTWMPPGLSLAYNGTGAWEHLTPDRGHDGPLVEFGDTYVNEAADITILTQKLGFAISAAGLGS